MFKVVTLIKRRPDLLVENFQAYWADHHGPLLKQAPGIRRYVQSHALPQGYRKGELLFDGISELWFDDESAYAACLESSAFKAADRDLDVFVDRPRLVEMPVDLYVIKEGAIPRNAVKNIEFVNRRPGMALAPFRAYWRNMHGPIASKITVIHRYEQNHLKLSAYDNGNPPYDGLAITWFASTADMKLGTTTREYQLTRADEPNFLPDGHLPIIIVRERVI
jgi:uncharacterized protein (TIGR02118 family)